MFPVLKGSTQEVVEGIEIEVCLKPQVLFFIFLNPFESITCH